MEKNRIIVGVIVAVLLLCIFLAEGSRNSFGYGDREQHSAPISGETEESDAETYVTECSNQKDMSVSMTDNDIKDMETYLYVDETAELWHVFTRPEWPYEYEEIPYADKDTFQTIMAAYEDIDYLGESIPVSEEDYEESLKNFVQLVKNEIPFYNDDTGEKMYVQEMQGYEQFHESVWKYYLWDINGDGELEACIRDGDFWGGSEFIFEYDSDMGEYFIWKNENQKDNCYVKGDYVGNGGCMWFPDYDSTIQEFTHIDTDGEPMFRSIFWACRDPAYHSEHNEYIYMVMIPWYTEWEKGIHVTEDMKQQGIFEKKSGQWYFRITEEQFKELEEPYRSAFETANKKLREDWMTYEELMNATDR